MRVLEYLKNVCKMRTANEVAYEIENFSKNGLPQGLTTGWREMDDSFSMKKGFLNVISGVPGSGKSEFLETLALNMSLIHEWKIWLYSPENYPLEAHIIKFITKAVKKPFMQISKDERDRALMYLDKNFQFVDSGTEAYALDQILFTIQDSINRGNKIDMVIIDPWNELEGSRPSGMTETDWIGESLKNIRRFSRKHDISFWIAAHPAKLKRRQDGSYPEPSMYDLSGSQHWYNKSDNAIIMHRTDEDKKNNNCVKVMIKKVKNSFYGKVSDHYFKLNTDTKCYEYDNKPLLNQLNLKAMGKL